MNAAPIHVDLPAAPNQSELLIERLYYEDQSLSQRTDWFLIFHAILLEAYFATHHKWEAGAVSLFGLVAAFLWLAVGYRQWWDHKHLAECLQSDQLVAPHVATLFRGISRVRREKQRSWYSWARATPAFAVVIPLGCTLLWLVLSIAPSSWMLLVVPVGLLAAFGLMRGIMDKPAIDPDAVKSLLADVGKPDAA